MVRLPLINHLALLGFFSIVTSTQQPVVDDFPSTDHESIAVIGAGISGALVAFELQDLTRPSPRYEVTIFERGSNVGGRVRSVPLPQKPRITVETGSSHFYDGDWCIKQLIKDVGLNIAGPDPNALPRTTGVWNGTDLWESSTCDSKASSWYELWKYGLSPWKYRRAVQEVSSKWNSFATVRFAGNLTKELEAFALVDPVSQSATQYVNEMGISSRYSSDLIDPCIRARSMQDLANVHGFTALMAAHQSRTGPIKGGNSRLVERLVKLSESELRLNTAVISIGPGQESRYTITYLEQQSLNVASYQEFDKIVLAAPLPDAKIDLGGLSTLDRTALPQYSDVHITHFLTPAHLSPHFFNLAEETRMTDDILAAGNASHLHGIHTISRSTKCWIDEDGCLPWMHCDQMICQNLYRAVSCKSVGDHDIVDMIGGKYKEDTPLRDQNLRWIHRQAWASAVPTYRPTVDFLEQVQIAPGLFYVTAGEEIVSSMEMSCRMGKHVAGRLYYGY